MDEMKMIWRIFLVMLVAFDVGVAQKEVTPDVTWDQMNELILGADVETFDMRPRAVIFRVYYDEIWRDGQFIVDGAPSKHTCPIKYDILNQEVNFLVGSVPYVMPAARIDGFILTEMKSGEEMNHEFVVVPHPRKEDKHDIYEVAVKGDVEFLVEHDADKSAPDYIPSLDLGSVDENITIKRRFFIRDTTGEIQKVPRGKRAGTKFFKDYPGASEYLEQNEVSFKERADIEALVRHINRTDS